MQMDTRRFLPCFWTSIRRVLSESARTLPGDDLAAAAPYFDVGPYERLPVDDCPGYMILGGVRERVFYPEVRARSLGRRDYTWLYES